MKTVIEEPDSTLIQDAHKMYTYTMSYMKTRIYYVDELPHVHAQ